jgi:hypothetical protein
MPYLQNSALKYVLQGRRMPYIHLPFLQYTLP